MKKLQSLFTKIKKRSTKQFVSNWGSGIRKFIDFSWITKTRKSTILSFICAAIIVYFLLIVTYGFLYYYSAGLSYSNGKKVKELQECLYFSLITFQTIGYGDIVPAVGLAKRLIFFESVTSAIFNSLFSGFLVYFFIQRPNNLIIADSCLIKCVEDKFFFSLRLGNFGEEVIDCKATIEFLYFLDTGRETSLLVSSRLTILEKTWAINFDLSLTENEKLRLKLKDIVNGDEVLFIRFVFSGTDKSRGTPVILSKYYKDHDLKFGKRFKSVHTWDKQKLEKTKINWKVFDGIEISESDLKKKFLAI